MADSRFVQNAFQNCSAVVTVQVWFDDYQKYYYVATGFRRLPTTDLANRHLLRQRLQCRSFGWFLANVLPDLGVPQLDMAYYGQLKNAYGGMCMRWQGGDLVTSDNTENSRQPSLEPCGYHDPSDTFSYMQRNHSIVHAGSGLCLTATIRGRVFLDECSTANDGMRGRPSQVWLYSVKLGSPLSKNASGSGNSESDNREEDVARELLLHSPDATDAEKPIGRLTVQLSNVDGEIQQKRTLCLAQVTWSNGRQMAGTIDCAEPKSTSIADERFTYWLFTYRLDWNVWP